MSCFVTDNWVVDMDPLYCIVGRVFIDEFVGDVGNIKARIALSCSAVSVKMSRRTSRTAKILTTQVDVPALHAKRFAELLIETGELLC